MKKNRTYGLMENIGLLKMIKIMRFTIFILFLSLSQAFAIDSYSQQTKLSLDFKNAKVEDVLDKIEKSSEFYFMYNKGMVDVERKIDIQVEGKGINQILDKVFQNTGISYSIKDRQILLINNSMVNNVSENISQQQKSISGKVSDTSGAPLPGVTVIIKGTTTGTITDANGNYSLSNVPENAILKISFVGMKTQEITVSGKTSINITMDEETVGIEEVVAVGYGTQKKVDLIGSVSSISSLEILRGQPVSIEQSLKGKVAGVQIQNSDGTPGGGIIVKVRGANSITAGNAPLYVVNGFPYPVTDDPYNNPLSKLSPESIESISILKDVSSTAIYGAQGANGVILITTKSAKEGFSEFSVKGSYGISKLSKSLEMLDNEEYMRAMMMTAVMNGTWENTDFYQDYKNQIWKTDPSRFESYNDICLRAAKQQKYNISYSGGNSVVKNVTNLTFSDLQGIVINSNYKDFNLISNTSVQLLKNLKINSNISYDYNISDGGNYTNSIATFSPLIPKEWTFKDIDDNLYYTGKMDNPYRILTDTEQTTNKSQFEMQTNMDWEIIKGLNFITGIGVRKFTQDYKKFVPTTILSSFNNEGEASLSHGNGLNFRYSAQLNFTKTINKIHELAFTLVGEANSYENDGYSKSYTHFNTDLGWYGIPAAKNGTFVTTPSVWYDKSTMLSSAVMGNYVLKGRYLFKASMRADGSSKFGSENRWGYFPSGAVGWRISEEDFFKRSNLSAFVNNLKLRVSAGSVGNDQIDNYIYI